MSSLVNHILSIGQSSTKRPNVVVLGSGVIGLSTAIELTKRGFHPIVVAKDLAEDIHSAGFASPWAGCNWYSFAANDDLVHQEYDKVTFKYLPQLARERPDLCEMIPFCDVWNDGDVEDLWFKDLVPDYRRAVPGETLPGGYKQAICFKSFILHAPNYIAYLTQTLKDQGVKFMKARVGSLDQAYNLPLTDEIAQQLGLAVGSTLSVDLVINATGLGSKTLLGVQDEKVMPIRGQTVLVKSGLGGPGKRCYMGTRNVGVDANGKPHESAYIIPRPGPTDQVILGGTFLKNVWDTLPDLATSERILKDCFNLNPDLAGPEVPGKTRTWRDIEVISHNVGLRPGREGGARIELEERSLKTPSTADPLIPGPKIKSDVSGTRVGVVHAYGIGASGYQASMGIAAKAAGLAEDWRRKQGGQ